MQKAHVLPDDITYICPIGACQWVHQWHQALGLLATMQMASLLPNAITHNAAINACLKDQQWHQAPDL